MTLEEVIEVTFIILVSKMGMLKTTATLYMGFHIKLLRFLNLQIRLLSRRLSLREITLVCSQPMSTRSIFSLRKPIAYTKNSIVCLSQSTPLDLGFGAFDHIGYSFCQSSPLPSLYINLIPISQLTCSPNFTVTFTFDSYIVPEYGVDDWRRI